VEVANLELVVADVASVEIFQTANLEQCPMRALIKEVDEVVVSFVKMFLVT